MCITINVFNPLGPSVIYFHIAHPCSSRRALRHREFCPTVYSNYNLHRFKLLHDLYLCPCEYYIDKRFSGDFITIAFQTVAILERSSS